METKDIPEWCWERALALTCVAGGGRHITLNTLKLLYAGQALAKKIFETEQPPVDLDLIEARQVVVDIYTRTGQSPYHADAYLSGERDKLWSVQMSLAAIKRGRQLAKAERCS